MALDSREMVSLEENLFQTQRYQSQITDADVAFEIAQQARAQIIQQTGAQMLGQLNLIGTLSLELVFSLTR